MTLYFQRQCYIHAERLSSSFGVTTKACVESILGRTVNLTHGLTQAYRTCRRLSSQITPLNGQHLFFSNSLAENFNRPKIVHPRGYDMALQKNVVAKGQTTEHTIVWHYLDSYDKNSAEAREAGNQGRGPGTLDGRFVRNRQARDCVFELGFLVGRTMSRRSRSLSTGWCNT